MEHYKKIVGDWIKGNYYRLRNSLIGKNIFDEDVFHDSIIDLYDENRETGGFTTQEFSGLFFLAYKKNLIKRYGELKQYICYPDSVLDFIQEKYSDNSTYQEDTNIRKAKICRIAKDYIKCNFNSELYEAFLLHTHHGMSYNKLSRYLGVPKSTLYHQFNKICEQVKDNIVYS